MGKVKICGLCRPEDVDLAVGLGADFVGFIHVPGTARHQTPEQLAALLALVPDRVKRVIVVRNMNEDRLRQLRQDLPFDYFQFHGSEPPAFWTRFGGFPVVPMRADAKEDVVLPRDVPFALLDTAVGKQGGGTGKTFDWSRLKGLQGDFLVAGGLNPGNVGDLIAGYCPWGVDVSSGLEALPGHKDPEKMKQFMQNARRAYASACG